MLFSKTNEQLKEYTFSAGNQGPESMRQLLEAMRQCGLKNDALMDIFYEQISVKYSAFSEYGIFVFHDRYDVPAKGADKERQWESEEVLRISHSAAAPWIRSTKRENRCVVFYILPLNTEAAIWIISLSFGNGKRKIFLTFNLLLIFLLYSTGL